LKVCLIQVELCIFEIALFQFYSLHSLYVYAHLVYETLEPDLFLLLCKQQAPQLHDARDRAPGILQELEQGLEGVPFRRQGRAIDGGDVGDGRKSNRSVGSERLLRRNSPIVVF
jgi:hypothetical protein